MVTSALYIYLRHEMMVMMRGTVQNASLTTPIIEVTHIHTNPNYDVIVSLLDWHVLTLLAVADSCSESVQRGCCRGIV